MRTNKLATSLAIVFFFAAFTANNFAQQSGNDIKALRNEVEALKQGQTVIQRELAEIKNLLRAAAAQQRPPADPQGATFDISALPAKGNERAQLLMIEFSDYQCPFCSRFVRETLPQIERDYIQTGKLRYLFNDLPLESIHPQAVKAAEAAHCAGDENKYWQMHDQLFANNRALTLPELSLHAQAIGLSVPAFQQCLFADKYATKIRQRMTEAANVGVNGTPTFLLAVKTANDAEVKVVKVLSGAQPYGAFKAAIDAALTPSK